MTTTALQRIKEIEDEKYPFQEIKFLLKAFNVMREIAIKNQIERYQEEENSSTMECRKDIEEEFESEMSK